MFLIFAFYGERKSPFAKVTVAQFFTRLLDEARVQLAGV
jgi:hypothetical protein